MWFMFSFMLRIILEVLYENFLTFLNFSYNTSRIILNINVLNSEIFNDVDIIITSSEEKAYETAHPLCEKLHKEIIRDENLNEIKRDQGSYLKTKDEYITFIKLCMENRNHSYNNWETANHLLKRFSKAIQEIDLEFSKKNILIVAHGVVINLYFAKILGKLENTFERWMTNTFCDYGIIQNNKVIKDIAKIND